MFARRLLRPFALLLVASFAAAADKPLVEPGHGFNVADVQTTDAKLSVTGTTIRIETGHKQPWPGVRIPARAGGGTCLRSTA